MERKVSVNKMTLKGLTPGETINSVTFESDQYHAAFYIESYSDDIVSESAISESGINYGTNGLTGAISVAGKTGTAENSGGADHAWFVAFAPADNPKIAVAVLLENAGKGSKAVPAARNVMKYYLQNCYEK